MSARHEERRLRVERAVAAHAPALLTYLVRRTTPPHDAADLLAETLVVVWRRAAALPAHEEEARAWMFGIARNVLLRHHRGVRRREAIADRLRIRLAEAPRPGFTDSSEFADLHDALAGLDQVDRDIIGLVHWDGFALIEVSRILRMKEGTVRSRYARARARLRDELGGTDSQEHPRGDDRVAAQP